MSLFDGKEVQRVVVECEGHREIRVTVGSDPHRVAEAVRASREDALKQGHTVVENGARIYRERRVTQNPSEDGSRRYTWHQDGDRVRAQWFEITVAPDGTETEKPLRRVWVSYANI